MSVEFTYIVEHGTLLHSLSRRCQILSSRNDNFITFPL